MKLLVDARVGWGHGIGRVIANTVPRIARLRSDWRIDVLVGPANVAVAEAAFVQAENLTVRPCPVRPFSVAEQWNLSQYASGYDLTWFTNYVVPLGWRGRFVVTVHDMLHLIPDYNPTTWAKRELSCRTFSKVRRDARVVMFDSRFTQQEFDRIIGAPDHGGIVVPLAADHLDYGEPVAILQRRRQLLVVAASKKHKNFALLLNAWKAARLAPHWALTIVSSGATLQTSIDVDDLAKGSGRTRVLSDLSNEALAALYKDTAILLMPSLYEGFGLPLLEGMLAGALCISSAAGAMVEIAEGSFVQFVNGNDLHGWIAAIEAACATIDRHDLDLDPLLRHNRDCASRLSWNKTAAQIADVLDQAI